MASAKAVLGVGGIERAERAVVKRVASALVLMPVFAWLVVWGPEWLFQSVVVAAAGVGAWEVGRLFDRGGHPVYRPLGSALSAALAASFAVPSAVGAPAYPVLVLALSVVAIVSAPVWSGAPPTSDAPAYTLLALVYVGWMLGFAMLLHALPEGARLVLFVATVTWAGEIAALLVGSAMGRHRLAPVLSPRKTVEGATAQLAVSIVAALGLAPWLLAGCDSRVALGAGGLLGVVGQLGDLSESALKRSVGAKDTGSLIPGHGGLLDRIDSLLFNVPAFYFYLVVTGCP